jgi:hypothetical protein
MSEVDGSFGFRGIFSGFLCGASIALLAAGFFSSAAIVPLASVAGRRLIFSGAVAACGDAFFV